MYIPILLTSRTESSALNTSPPGPGVPPPGCHSARPWAFCWGFLRKFSRPPGQVGVPSGTPGLPRRRKLQWVWGTARRRRQWVQLVVIESCGEWRCPQLGLLPPWDRPASLSKPCVRSSVALPPGIGGRAAHEPHPFGCFTGLPGEKFNRENPVLECRAAPRTARGGGGSRDPTGRSCSTCRISRTAACRKSSSGAIPLGTRTGPPLPEAKDDDSANREELCKILGPKLGRVLPMAAAAPPRGRPQYAALRDEIAPFASGGRKTSSRNQTAIVDRASRRHPTRRKVPLGTRKLELALQRPLAATRSS